VPLKNACLDPAHLPKSTKRVAISVNLSPLSALLACTAMPLPTHANKELRSVTKLTALKSLVDSTVLSALMLEPVLKLSLLQMEKLVTPMLKTNASLEPSVRLGNAFDQLDSAIPSHVSPEFPFAPALQTTRALNA
jgi:hypothetical protein